MSNDIKKATITYPCTWEYCVIGQDEMLLRDVIFEVMPRKYDVRLARQSKSGKFVSLHINIEVQSEEERNNIFTRLSTNKEIKMVL